MVGYEFLLSVYDCIGGGWCMCWIEQACPGIKLLDGLPKARREVKVCVSGLMLEPVPVLTPLRVFQQCNEVTAHEVLALMRRATAWASLTP